jgi:NADPH:quinone reductase-like Zn-dependent oxidoreductase
MINNVSSEVGSMGLRAVYTKAGDPVDVVELIDMGEPRDPGSGQVLIRVTLFPIHWGDLQTIQLASPTGRVGAGVEATGVVEKVGSGVHHLKPPTRALSRGARRGDRRSRLA